MTMQDVFDPGGESRDELGRVAMRSQNFGGTAEGRMFGLDQAKLNDLQAALRNQMNGGNTQASEQLRQGLQQQAAQQQALASSASPNNSAMATRMALNNSARLGYGLSGQQAQASIMEREQAAKVLAEMYAQQRQQDMQAALGGYSTATQGFGTATSNPGPNATQAMIGGVGAVAGLAALSDKRTKKEIKSGDKAASKLLDGLKAYTFKYKDERNGKGARVGIMAQDLEKAGAKHAVIDTPAGKVVHGGHLATALAAVMPTLHKRISKLEAAER